MVSFSCSGIGQFSWSGAEMALTSCQTVFLSLVLFGFLALLLGPGHISFTGSNSKDKECFFDTSFRVRAHVFSPGFRDKDISFPGPGLRSGCFFHWLWVQSQRAQ